jgi:two-component system sensor histidine kinase PhoQ
VVTAQISLKIRQGFILVFVLVVALPILFYSISKAYYATLVDATEKNLETHLYSLISEVDITDEGIIMPNSILTPELNSLNSDTYAMIYRDNEAIWHSESAVNVNFVPHYIEPKAGDADYRQVTYNKVVYWQLSLTVILGNIDKNEQTRFILLKRNDALVKLMDGFKQTLVDWMFIMGIAIAALIAIGFIWSARPLQRLDKEIKAIESGDIQEIKGFYPIELQTIKADLNLLLESQQRQKERYRASLSDLAHALKTPLAVLKSSPLANDADAQEQLDRINVMIEHQLKRAATGASDTWKKQTPIKPILDSILSAMGKVYRDKDIIFNCTSKDSDFFLGDQTDLMELLGNLIDNACKACRSQVTINIKQTRNLSIHIHDDGPGVPEDKRESLLTRGTRLDTYESGHGVGMAIVSDLVTSYHGMLTIDRSSLLGGAQFTLEFSYNDKK